MFKATMVAPIGVTSAVINGKTYKVGKDRKVKVDEPDIAYLREQGFIVEDGSIEEDPINTEENKSLLENEGSETLQDEKKDKGKK
jgi:hypothetical protein